MKAFSIFGLIFGIIVSISDSCAQEYKIPVGHIDTDKTNFQSVIDGASFSALESLYINVLSEKFGPIHAEQLSDGNRQANNYKLENYDFYLDKVSKTYIIIMDLRKTERTTLLLLSLGEGHMRKVYFVDASTYSIVTRDTQR